MPPSPNIKLGKSYSVRFIPGTDLLVCLGQKVKLRGRLGRDPVKDALPFSHPSDCVVAPDAKTLAVKSTLGAIALLDIPTLRPVWTLPPTDEGGQILFSPCGRFLVTGWRQGELSRVALADGAREALDHAPATMLTWLSQTADRHRFAYVRWPIAVGNAPPGASIVALRFWPLALQGEQRLAGPWRIVWAAEISPDGRWLAVLHQREGLEFQVDLVDTESARVLASAPILFGGTNTSLAWSPDARLLACVRKDGATVFEAPALQVTAQMAWPYACHVCFSPDGEYLAIGGWTQGTVKRVADLPSLLD